MNCALTPTVQVNSEVLAPFNQCRLLSVYWQTGFVKRYFSTARS